MIICRFCVPRLLLHQSSGVQGQRWRHAVVDVLGGVRNLLRPRILRRYSDGLGKLYIYFFWNILISIVLIYVLNVIYYKETSVFEISNPQKRGHLIKRKYLLTWYWNFNGWHHHMIKMFCLKMIVQWHFICHVDSFQICEKNSKHGLKSLLFNGVRITCPPLTLPSLII